MQLENEPRLVGRHLDGSRAEQWSRYPDESHVGADGQLLEESLETFDCDGQPPTIHTFLPDFLREDPRSHLDDEGPQSASSTHAVANGNGERAKQWKRGAGGVSFMQLNSGRGSDQQQAQDSPAEPNVLECDDQEAFPGDHPVLKSLRDLGLVEGTPRFGLMFSEKSGGPLFTPLQLVRAFSNEFTVTCMQLLRLLRQLPPIKVGGIKSTLSNACPGSCGGSGEISAEVSTEQTEASTSCTKSDADGAVAARPIIIETLEWVIELGPEAEREWQVCTVRTNFLCPLHTIVCHNS